MRWPLPSVCPRATGLIGTANRDGRFHLCNRDDTPRGYHPRTADRCPRTHSRQRLRGKATPARPRRLRGTYARSNDVDSVGASTPPKVSLGPISNIFSLSSYGPFDGVEEHLLANRRVTPYIGLADGSKCERFEIDNRQPKCLNRGGFSLPLFVMDCRSIGCSEISILTLPKRT